MPLTKTQKRWLKQQVHHLKPVVTLGQQGFTPAVQAELERALAHHELLKIRLGAADRAERDALLQDILIRTQSELIARIGHIAALWRPNPRKRDPLRLPPD